MFKMGCSMARKILGPGPAAAEVNEQPPAACMPADKSNRTKPANADELGDFSKLDEDPRLPLNVRQIFKITKSWKAIARTMSKTGTAMFLNLFEQNQDLFYLFDRFQHLKGRELHESMELREHAATVMSTLDQSINSLSDYDQFVSYLHSIGQLHRKVPGFKREYFWKIEQPFMKAVKQTLDERCNETIEQIYVIAIKLIIETIADGYGQDGESADMKRDFERQSDAGAGGNGPSTNNRGNDGHPLAPGAGGNVASKSVNIENNKGAKCQAPPGQQRVAACFAREARFNGTNPSENNKNIDLTPTSPIKRRGPAVSDEGPTILLAQMACRRMRDTVSQLLSAELANSNQATRLAQMMSAGDTNQADQASIEQTNRIRGNHHVDETITRSKTTCEAVVTGLPLSNEENPISEPFERAACPATPANNTQDSVDVAAFTEVATTTITSSPRGRVTNDTSQIINQPSCLANCQVTRAAAKIAATYGVASVVASKSGNNDDKSVLPLATGKLNECTRYKETTMTRGQQEELIKVLLLVRGLSATRLAAGMPPTWDLDINDDALRRLMSDVRLELAIRS